MVVFYLPACLKRPGQTAAFYTRKLPAKMSFKCRQPTTMPVSLRLSSPTTRIDCDFELHLRAAEVLPKFMLPFGKMRDSERKQLQQVHQQEAQKLSRKHEKALRYTQACYVLFCGGFCCCHDLLFGVKLVD